MPLHHIVIMALLQGFTEFLPVSSSAHLILDHALLGDVDEHIDLIMDIAAHVGTLVALLIYFYRDILAMIASGPALLTGGWKVPGSPAALSLLVIVGSVPALAVGYALHVLNPAWQHSLLVIAWTQIIFGILLWLADRYRPSDRTINDLSLKDAVLIGLAQSLSLIPGVSRSGSTMTAARALGFARVEAVRYSFFLAAVAIAGAGVIGGIELYKTHDATLAGSALLAAVISFISGYAAIALLLRWLAKATFLPFVIYRVALGVVLLALLYSGALAGS